MRYSEMKKFTMRLALAVAAAMGLAAFGQAASALPVVAPGYSLSVFATAPIGATKADDVAIGGPYVFVAFGNGGLPDGSDGKSGTVAQYTNSGTLIRTYSLLGHTDGIRVDPSTGLLWAIQNEDGNPNLQVINPVTATQTPYTFGPTPHGGGYDDLRFLGGKAYLSASNPTLSGVDMINTGPALVQAALSGSTVSVTPVIQGNASATDVVSGKTVSLNLTDPDSQAVDNAGNIVLDSQADNQLAIIHNPASISPTVNRLLLIDSIGDGVSADDSLFLPSGKGRILLIDSGTNIIYALDSATFATGQAFSSLPSGATPNAGTFDSLNLATGVESPVITGLGSPKGLEFLPIPLPNAAYVGMAGLVCVIAGHGLMKRRLAVGR